ncbi:hypothetical protein DPX16_14658 [Anabarilius grahami]|uniref:TRIM8/14/16/25/29/45/65 coiled-coil region domain-containing protein n=1 Tax=Anabarilius grahami TaxID=495550 RepID=A0A3N0XNV1_ANAGA|nr:hypothetical protein DPX16_14658 [Anabarilius grahami]
MLLCLCHVLPGIQLCFIPPPLLLHPAPPWSSVPALPQSPGILASLRTLVAALDPSVSPSLVGPAWVSTSIGSISMSSPWLILPPLNPPWAFFLPVVWVPAGVFLLSSPPWLLKQFKETQIKLRQRIQQREKNLQQLRESVESHKRSAQTAVEDSERIFTELIRSIERSRSEATHRIRDQEKAAVSQAEELEQEINDLRKRDAELEQLLHTNDHLHVLQLRVKLEDFCKDELKKISDRGNTRAIYTSSKEIHLEKTIKEKNYKQEQETRHTTSTKHEPPKESKKKKQINGLGKKKSRKVVEQRQNAGVMECQARGVEEGLETEAEQEARVESEDLEARVDTAEQGARVEPAEHETTMAEQETTRAEQLELETNKVEQAELETTMEEQETPKVEQAEFIIGLCGHSQADRRLGDQNQPPRLWQGANCVQRQPQWSRQGE